MTLGEAPQLSAHSAHWSSQRKQKATCRLKGGGKGLRKNDGGGTTGIKGKESGIQAKRKERNRRKEEERGGKPKH